LDAGGPGFVDSAAGQHVGAAGTFADARVSAPSAAKGVRLRQEP
jgi:hypothetical protein